jgi:hypothetical protein
MTKRKNPLVIDRQEDGRPILVPRLGQRLVPDPRKTPTKLGSKVLPQLPSVSPSKIHGAPKLRRTARPR